MEEALKTFGIESNNCRIQLLGNGLINDTCKIEVFSSNNTACSEQPLNTYVFQKINENVFKNPTIIDNNINNITDYLKEHNPSYIFTSTIPNLYGKTMVYIPEHGFYRLFQYIPESFAYDQINNSELAYEAAKQFGLFTAILNNLPIENLQYTIPDFHNLSLRYHTLLNTIHNTSKTERYSKAKYVIDSIMKYKDIVGVYEETIMDNPEFKRRVTHHDTKISNVLFDKDNKGICVIDLDTVMPGYFISDLGDMFRTYLCADTEESIVALCTYTDTTPSSHYRIRLEYFQAIVTGYLEAMYIYLTPIEKTHILYAGKYIIYMQAIRFIDDYLNNDSYHKIRYSENNLNRAINQMRLLEEYIYLTPVLNAIVDEIIKTKMGL